VKRKLVDELLGKVGDSKRPALSIVSDGAKTSIPAPSMRGPSWQAVRTLLVEAFKVCAIDPAFDHDGPTPGRERDRERRAIFKAALSKVEEHPGIFSLWCRRAEALARADEAIFCLGEHQLNPDDEESRQITVDWLNFGDPRRELEFCEAEHLSEIDLRRHIRRCCEAIARQLVAEPTKKPAPLDHLRERDLGYGGETVFAAGRVFAGNDRGDRRRFYGAERAALAYEIRLDELGDRTLTAIAADAPALNGLVFGVDEIAAELRRSVELTKRKIDHGEIPVGEYFGQLCAHRALLRPFRERHPDRRRDPSDAAA